MIHVLCFLFHCYDSPPSLSQLPVCPAPALSACTCSLIAPPHLCSITPLISLCLFPSLSLLLPVRCIHWSPSSVLSSLSHRVWSLLLWGFGKPLPEFLDWLSVYQTVLTMNRSLSRIPALYQQFNTAGEHTTAYICGEMTVPEWPPHSPDITAPLWCCG